MKVAKILNCSVDDLLAGATGKEVKQKMGISDAFKPEDRIEMIFSSFASLTKEAVKSELLMNAVNCNVPHRYIREMATGNSEDPVQEAPLEYQPDPLEG